jgi:hypothetical protein
MKKEQSKPTGHFLLAMLATLAGLAQSPAVAQLPAEVAGLKPLMVVPDRAVLEDDFSTAHPLDPNIWRVHQETRWNIENGVLHGWPASSEFQASRADHNGLEPRISFPGTPREFAARFSFRFSGGEWITEYKPGLGLAPMIEFGHHICRIAQQPAGIQIRVENEAIIVAETQQLKLEPERWYHVLAEWKGDEFVLQFANGPTLYAKHDIFLREIKASTQGLWIGGPRLGEVEIDNLSLWSIKPEVNPAWEQTRATLPPPQTVSRRERKAAPKN